MENISPEDPTISKQERFPVGKLGGMFASVPETIAPIDPNDMTKGMRHVLSGKVTGETTEGDTDLSTKE